MASTEIRPIRVDGNIAYVPLTQGYEAIIDAADVSLLEAYNWSAIGARTGFVYARRGRRAIMMHRVLMDAPIGMEVDHINGNTLDNRRSNLRVVTKSQNQHNAKTSRANKSGAKGVFRHKNNWSAQIRVNKRLIHLGRFDSLEAAASAYATASRQLHGEFGRVA